MLPAAGDIFWVELDPVAGTEQAGRRPTLVLSSAGYHAKSSRAVVCPITRTPGSWAFNVSLPSGMRTVGVVLVDQVRTIHRPSRLFDFVETAPAPLLADVRARLAVLVGFDLASGDIA